MVNDRCGKADNNNQKRLLLIGGYPKGFPEPFDKRTVSGRRLHTIIEKHKLNAKFYDLWNSESEEKKGFIEDDKISELKWYFSDYRIIALGKWVHTCLTVRGINCEYLPHPAARTKRDHHKLEMGLINQ